MPPVVVTLPNSSTEPPASVVSDAATTLLSNLVSPELLTVTPASGSVKPKALLKVTAPDPAVTVKPRAALPVAVLINSAKLMAPFVDARVTVSVNEIAVAKPIALPVPVTEMLPPRLLAPTPDWLNAPVELIVPAAIVVKVLELAIVTAPTAVTAALTVKPAPVNERAPASVVAPPIVVRPVPAFCVRLTAVKAAPMVTSLAEASVTAPSAPVVVTAPLVPA